MAFGIVNYAYAIAAALASVCVMAVLSRYIRRRQGLALFFVFFLAACVVLCLTYALRGFYEVYQAPELLLWLLQNYMYIVITVPLALFLIYPLLQQTRGQRSYYILWAVIAAIGLIALFNALMIAVSQIEFTFTDNYGLAHYRLVYLPIPNVYIITLGLDVMVSNVSLVLLAISYRKESDPFYKRRALFLFVGWTIVTYAQLLHLEPSLVILNPFALIIGTILVSIAVYFGP
ncbi:MAG: hypothetical protein C4K47_04280 [Candidatus Thorarchaeota archaeon]|nr:MAG: hypothetical protein C4K47_04280 [Candidatus Thorarchaeota archaeon]